MTDEEKRKAAKKLREGGVELEAIDVFNERLKAIRQRSIPPQYNPSK